MLKNCLALDLCDVLILHTTKVPAKKYKKEKLDDELGTLISKVEEFGKIVITSVSETYSSKTCSHCGSIKTIVVKNISITKHKLNQAYNPSEYAILKENLDFIFKLRKDNNNDD
ncbi:hypothetical protein Glove_216g120 [Diversispora epigaea]|uniref:Cas12f1-like TNB domain-containing protein n=1 Tax=Diversispora epigaea TaxID=1348612 RepID=A0A397IHB6_9GLOM|nr:hypothetical protein Glove_216g120 [Diversispora epigaea]